MTDSNTVIRSLITYGIILPLAILLGYMLGSQPAADWASIWYSLNWPTLILLGVVMSILGLPLFLRWHHPLLFMSWNAAAVVFFLPGQPELWLFMALASFIVVAIQRAVRAEFSLPPVSLVHSPMIFLLIVVLATAYLNGGIHLGSLGSDSLGGRKYLYMIAAILGYIAMTAVRIPENKAGLYVGIFFLSALTSAFGDLVQVTGSWLSFLLVAFPVTVGTTFLEEASIAGYSTGINRDWGLTVACTGALFYMLAKYGVKNIVRRGILKKVFVLVFFAGSMIGGFRSFLILNLMAFFFMFCLEGLVRSKYVWIPVVLLALAVPLLPYVNKLHPSIQRTVSFLPYINVSPEVRFDAQQTSGWRIEMWKTAASEIPQYFWLGKGFTSNTSEFIATLNYQARGMGDHSESQMMAGDYHNGPLSIILPFGIWGVIGALWFFAASFRALHLNYRHGAESLKIINTCLLAIFIARFVLFIAVFGSFYTDLAIFGGLVALSISLNGGVRRPATAAASRVAAPIQKVKSAPRFVPSPQP